MMRGWWFEIMIVLDFGLVIWNIALWMPYLERWTK